MSLSCPCPLPPHAWSPRPFRHTLIERSFMGYTHYWRINTAELEPRHFFALVADAPALFDSARSAGIDVTRESDRPNELPRLAGGLIIFNGPGDLGHETFCLDLSPHRPPAVARPVERDDDQLAWWDWYNYD